MKLVHTITELLVLSFVVLWLMAGCAAFIVVTLLGLLYQFVTNALRSRNHMRGQE